MGSTRTLSLKSSDEPWIQDIYKKAVQIFECVLGNKETYDVDLERVGTNYFGSKFAGVFACDTIPLSTNFKYCITNLDSQQEPGSHWVAIAKQNGKCLVYDSFGRHTSDILPNLKDISVDTEHDPEQAANEDNCGARCMAWLLIYDLFGQEVAKTI